MRRRLAAALAAVVLLPGLASAQESAAALGFKPAANAFWRTSAEMDVAAAWRMLRDDHPGAAPEVGDDAFREILRAAHATAAARARRVSSYEGYVATLAAFANAFGDKHMRSRPRFLPSRPVWAGLIIAKRGERWVVADEDASSPAEALRGATLLSCDGREPDDWGRELLGGFRADWRVEAQQEQAAPWLLVSEGNPFVRRPATCRFEINGVRREVQLAWRSIRRDALTPRLEAAVDVGAAGYGVRRAGDGYWIALQGLGDARARGVVASVAAQAAALRSAPFVILDLRGNGGGSSEYGRQIAGQLLGKAHIEATFGAAEPCGGWRVSPANLRELERDARVFAGRGPEFMEQIHGLQNQAHAAARSGRAFSAPLSCGSARPVTAAPPSMFKGRLFVVTDGLCFSSCLNVVEDFRHLGAAQLGRTTDAATHYYEVSDRPMPSGLSTFSTMMAVSASDPPGSDPSFRSRSSTATSPMERRLRPGRSPSPRGPRDVGSS